jgi:hypothetical protein
MVIDFQHHYFPLNWPSVRGIYSGSGIGAAPSWCHFRLYNDFGLLPALDGTRQTAFNVARFSPLLGLDP